MDTPVGGNGVRGALPAERRVDGNALAELISLDGGDRSVTDAWRSRQHVEPAEAAAGDTPRVRALKETLAERQQLKQMQDAAAWQGVDTPKVMRERIAADEAQRLQQLLRDPARRALSTARWRRNLTRVLGSGLALTMLVTIASVQRTVAGDAPEGSGQWWFAWIVEPTIAVLVLGLFAFRAFMATEGEIVDDPWLTRTEVLLLSVSFTLVTWLYLPGVAEDFEFVQLLAHGVWPIIAVLIVICLPRIWARLGDLDHGPVADPDLVKKLGVVRQLIADGALAVDPSRSALAKALRTAGVQISDAGAQRVHRCLTGRIELL